MRTWMMVLASAMMMLGCGDDDTGGSSSSGSSGSSQDLHCCINGSYYQCPTEDALSNCISDPSGCTRDESKDSTCN